ncbi:MAG TPA: YbhB/YbcL family Raf kinase inhibitor-like protein, partial [Isosphaeraceae bacterium]
TSSLLLASCGRGPSPDAMPPAGPARRTIGLRSPAFADGGPIPTVYTCDGQDVSPPLAWSGVPEGAVALALIADDPDAPRGTWTHWILYDLPADVTELTEGLPPVPILHVASARGTEDDVRQGRNDFGRVGYGGPCPPAGTHHYAFRIVALDARLDLEPGAARDRVLRALKGHVLAEGRLIGTYSR